MSATQVGPIVASAGLPGGISAWLNVSAALVVKAAPGVLALIIVNTVGSAGSLTVNDCTTTGAAAASNQIASWPIADLAVGQCITLNWPCGTGITLSAMPTAGVVSISYS